jgi:hypothetical protein
MRFLLGGREKGPGGSHEAAAAEPGVDVVSGVADALAAHGEASADRRARAGVGVLVCRRAETADGVGGDGQDGLASEVALLGERPHDHGRPDVPERAGQHHDVVAIDGAHRGGDGRSGVRLLLADVARHRLVVVVRVGLGGPDAVHVAAQTLGDHAGEHLGVADAQVARPPYQ